MAAAGRERQRAQRLGPRDFWLEPWVEGSDHRLPPAESARRLSAADVHDAGRGRCGRQSGEPLAGVEAGWIVIPVEETTVTQRQGFRATAATAPALAYRRFLHQPVRPVLLLVQRSGGFSRFLVHWDMRESMREADVEVILERAKEKYPGAKPRIISDNGPQFIARDFKEFIRISGMTHVRTSARLA